MKFEVGDRVLLVEAKCLGTVRRINTTLAGTTVYRVTTDTPSGSFFVFDCGNIERDLQLVSRGIPNQELTPEEWFEKTIIRSRTERDRVELATVQAIENQDFDLAAFYLNK